MKRLMLGLVPFLAVNVCGMSLFGPGAEEKHKKFIDTIYDTGLKSLALPSKKSITFDKWDGIFDSALSYAKGNDKSFKESDFARIRQESTALKAFFKRLDEKLIDDIEKYVVQLSKLYNEYLQKAAEIKVSTTAAREKRYAQEALAALVNVMQLGALDLQQDVLDVARAKAALEKQAADLGGKAEKLAQSAEIFKKQAQELKRKSLRPSAFDKYLQQFTETLTNKQFDLLVKRIAAIGDEKVFGNVLHDVHEYAKTHNLAAFKMYESLNAANANKDRAEAARAEAKKIAESFFTSRSKRYPYELYAKLIDQAVSLKKDGNLKPKS